MPTWRDLRTEASARLAAGTLADPDREARWMVEEIAGLAAAALVADEEEPAPRARVASSMRW